MAILVTTMLLVVREAWHVLWFALIVTAGLVAAFIQYARHAPDHEQIVRSEDCLVIQRMQLAPRRTRIGFPKRQQDLIDLQDSSASIEAGRFIPAKRWLFAAELRRELLTCGETGVQAQVVSMAESGNPL